MTKYILVAVIIIALAALVGCIRTTDVIGEQKIYDITSELNSLEVKINAADFIIEQGDEFSVESNLKHLTVSEKDGVLMIDEKTKRADSYSGAKLKLYIPENTVFEDVKITTGAGILTVDSLYANNMKLKTGAGKVELGKLDINSNIHIIGGAGEVKIMDGTLNNLSLDLGVGELDMIAELLGESNLKFGVSESNLTLIGSKDDYSFDIKQGVGKINLDNSTFSTDVDNENGQNLVKIKGGVGKTNISFQE